eukprot:3160545-Heterocapsa_arctica.AAC.1
MIVVPNWTRLALALPWLEALGGGLPMGRCPAIPAGRAAGACGVAGRASGGPAVCAAGCSCVFPGALCGWASCGMTGVWFPGIWACCVASDPIICE